jgi:hypothetical protein
LRCPCLRPILRLEGESLAKVASLALTRLESLLAARKLDATVARADDVRRPAVTTAGIASLDTALGGGWACGEISEVIGDRSSGRTGVLLAALASATANGGIAALIDTFDRLDPVTAAAAGVDLARVLWVRGPALSLPGRPGMAAAAVKQAIRAFDLVMRAGGFGLVALDLAGAPSSAFRDLAPATWQRLAHAIAGQPSAALMIGDRPMGRSARGVTVRLAATPRWTGDSPQSRRLAGLDIQAHIERAQRPISTAPTWSLRAAG